MIGLNSGIDDFIIIKKGPRFGVFFYSFSYPKFFKFFHLKLIQNNIIVGV